MTASRPAVYRVLAEILSRILPLPSIAAARRLVPPISTPIEYSCMRSNDNRSVGCFMTVPVDRPRACYFAAPASRTRRKSIA